MATLFISHSSADDAAVKVLEAWLHEHGFTDIFADHSSIEGGDKWTQALRDATGACRVVVCFVTERWLASDECFGEFKAAWYMGRRLLPLFALPADYAAAGERLDKVRAEDQGFDVSNCIDAQGRFDLARDPELERRLEAGLRAAGALNRVGLDPAAFAIDRKLRAMPFPGLASFGDDDADAALFYGRSREIADALEELRKVRAERDLRPFVILGASGAGKSSLLKAGIIPRLRREAPAWLPLRAFRPGADPLLNFAEALARTLADFGKFEAHGVIRDRLFDAWKRAERDNTELTEAGRATLDEVLEAEGRKLRNAAGRAAATILISVDQAEEMARADGESGDALADYLRAALTAAGANWQLAFTIRTDSFPELQGHRRFQDLKARGYDLRAIPVFRFDSVVEEPARRYGVKVDHTLVDALMEDAPKEDALPLLAFALQRLWRQYALSGALLKQNYDRVGGLQGLIEDAAERALRGYTADDDVPLQSGPPPKHRIELGASTFVPALAQINDLGATIRRVAEWKSFSDEQQELLLRFDQWRLVVRKGTEADGGTVEVAHEALFREWTRLQSWLEPERAWLEALRSLQVDALTWERNGRDVAFLNHRDKRLAEARTLTRIESYRKRLGVTEFNYLTACEVAERSSRGRARRRQAAIYVLLVGIIAGLVGWINQAVIKDQVNWYWRMRPYAMANFRPNLLTPEAERALKPLQTFRECSKDCPEMVVIPAGHFTMGSPQSEKDRTTDEGPQHDVTFVKPFAESKYDVTFDDWDACYNVGGCPYANDSGMGRGKKPVINVSWDDAQQYVAWLSKMTGREYRLPSESEWEYATRAGTDTAYYWGNELGAGHANLGQYDNSKTTPVGAFPPNAFGLYDTLGNVWQWVQDCHHLDYNGAPADGSAWSDAICSRRVVRGGYWPDCPVLLRSALRCWDSDGGHDDYLGLRVVRTLE